ncbi:hypothetical protein JTE90_017540 [Oedothorax gibbosus]|uniref:Alpha-latrotoxin n=1 Tax=Oedothorax gibbosus TaxID=931172 RepID=A0AAV6TWY4_9ARAC|nr:hypothetical protein JTE90_017540 [Oedothorax gibbosus]
MDRELLETANIGVNYDGFSRYTSFHRCMSDGHLTEVEEIEEKNNELHCTPLLLASKLGKLEVVKELLNQPGINVNEKDKNGQSALHHSICKGHLQVVNTLLKAPGVMVNEKDGLHGFTPLHMAIEYHHFDAVEALLTHPDTDIDAKDDCGQAPLYTAAFHGDMKVVEMLLQGGADTYAKTDQGFSVVYYPAKHGHSRLVEVIVNHRKRIKAHGEDRDARKKQIDVLRQRKHRARFNKINKITDEEVNELHFQLLKAAENGDLKKVDELLSDPRTNVNCRDRYRNTPLHLSARKGYVQLVKRLLQVKDIDVNANNKDDTKSDYPLHTGDIPNRADSDIGKTPLHLAVDEKHVEVVRLLLDHPKIDVNAKDKYGEFPLWLAVENNDEITVGMLLNHLVIDVNARYIFHDHLTALHDATDKENEEIVRLLLKHPKIDVNAKEKHRNFTPLNVAVRRNAVEVVKAILEHKRVDVNATDKMLRTPLHHAAEQGNSRLLSLLIKSNGRMFSRDIINKTPCQLLKENRADASSCSFSPNISE